MFNKLTQITETIIFLSDIVVNSLHFDYTRTLLCFVGVFIYLKIDICQLISIKLQLVSFYIIHN